MKRQVTIVIIVVALGSAGLWLIQLGVIQNPTTSNLAQPNEETHTPLSSTKVSSTESNVSKYEMQIASLEAERSNYTSRVSDLEAKISETVVEIESYRDKASELESQISTLEAEKKDYETQISQLEEELTDADVTIEEYQIETLELESQLLDLESEVTSLSATQNLYKKEIETLNEETNSLEEEITRLTSLAEYYETETTNLQNKIDSQTSQIYQLESRLDNILDIEVTQHYEWVYGSWFWTDRYQWDLPIPLSLYCEYYERTRPSSWANWVDMVKDSSDDRYIDEMVQQINSAAISEGYTEAEKVKFVVAFIQSLPYTVDSVTTPWNEYPRYPIETLFNRGGDCEDTSILAAALLDRMGYDVALLFLKYEKHCALGVSIAGASGSYYLYEGVKYFYLETTGDGFDIGQIPSTFEDTRASIYPIYS